jgi:hypothetical protein
MICAPFADAPCSSCASSASAGGQLEHPSDVNSSTTTVFRCAAGAGVGLSTNAPKATTKTSAKVTLSQLALTFIPLAYIENRSPITALTRDHPIFSATITE